MLFGTLAACLLENFIACKGVIGADKGAIRTRQGIYYRFIL